MSFINNETHENSFNFELERDGDWFYARVYGAILTYAEVIGNRNDAIWSTYFSEKQTASNRLLRKVIGHPFPMSEFFKILCAQPTHLLKTSSHPRKTVYQNATTKIIAGDLTQVGSYRLPFSLVIASSKTSQTILEIEKIALDQNENISSKRLQAQKARIEALPK